MVAWCLRNARMIGGSRTACSRCKVDQMVFLTFSAPGGEFDKHDRGVEVDHKSDQRETISGLRCMV